MVNQRFKCCKEEQDDSPYQNTPKKKKVMVIAEGHRTRHHQESNKNNGIMGLPGATTQVPHPAPGSRNLVQSHGREEAPPLDSPLSQESGCSCYFHFMYENEWMYDFLSLSSIPKFSLSLSLSDSLSPLMSLPPPPFFVPPPPPSPSFPLSLALLLEL